VAGYAGEDYDVAVMAVAEAGEYGFDEVYLAEEDGFELVADEVLGRGVGGEFFDCADDSCLSSEVEFN
jgi:hypothetical protein